MKYLWTEDTGAGLHFWKLVNQLFFDNALVVESKESNPDNSEIITMPKSAKELEDAIERVYLKRYHAPNLTRPLRQRNSHV